MMGFQCECLTWDWAPEMGPKDASGHHPSCPEGHFRGCECIRCRLFSGVGEEPPVEPPVASKVEYWNERLADASRGSHGEYHEAIVDAIDDLGDGFFLDVAGESIAWANYVIGIKKKAEERLKVCERALEAIAKIGRGETRWGLSEVNLVAQGALKGEDTFLSMLEMQDETERVLTSWLKKQLGRGERR